MRAIGEMLYKDPSQHIFIAFISRYLGDKTGYFAGWTYWGGLIFMVMTKLQAVASYVQYWFPHLPAWIIQVTLLVVLTSVNLIAVRLFGEAEFWFAMIKIVAILAMIVTGIIMVFSSFKTPTGHVAISNITNNFSMFPKGFTSFLTALPMVFYAFTGMEFVGITTAETKNPHKVLPKAINSTIIRIVIFYIGALLAIMAVYPWQNINTSQSPFVQVFSMIGIKFAASLINFGVLTAAASSINSFIYSAGRHLYQLSTESDTHIMNQFQNISSRKVPARCILFSAALMLIAPLVSLFSSITTLFQLISSTTSDLYLIVYALTVLAHYKYRKSADFDPDGFIAPFYKVVDPLLIVFFAIIYGCLFINGSAISATLGILWCVGFGFASSREKSTQELPSDVSGR